MTYTCHSWEKTVTIEIPTSVESVETHTSRSAAEACRSMAWAWEVCSCCSPLMSFFWSSDCSARFAASSPAWAACLAATQQSHLQATMTQTCVDHAQSSSRASMLLPIRVAASIMKATGMAVSLGRD